MNDRPPQRDLSLPVSTDRKRGVSSTEKGRDSECGVAERSVATQRVVQGSASSQSLGQESTPGEAILPLIADRYEIVVKLGRGGMGEVYLAWDTRLDRQVAVKVLSSPSKEMVTSFEKEAQILAGLEHDHIVRVYDYGFTEGTPYLVMEYLRGGTLATRLAEGRPTLIEAVRIALDVLKGLAEAHRRGIAHQDLKPGNVFVDESGRFKVADFGLAYRFVPASSQNSAHSLPEPVSPSAPLGGTPAYMSPEQWQGTPSGSSGDLYSLGVVLHEMLTGQKLFSIDPRNLRGSRTASEALPAPSAVNPCVPAALDKIVLQTLANDPFKRPEATVLMGMLQSWIDEAHRARWKDGSLGLPLHPYKFLAHYEATDRSVFFGRDAEIDELVELVENSSVRLALLFGPCGIGKSSLLRAGLAPALTPDRHEPFVLISGPDPARCLRETILARARHHGVGLAADPKFSSDDLVGDPRAVVELLVLTAKATGSAPVLIVDQLEELFTQNLRGSDRVADLFGLTQQLVETQAVPVKLIFSFRTEFRGSFFPLEERLGSHLCSIQIREIRESGLLEVIEGPSRFAAYGFQFQDGFAPFLAQEMSRATLEARDAILPVAQIVLRKLFDRMKACGASVIGRDLYDKALGGVRQALRRYVEERLADGKYEARGAIARQMLKALTVKEGGERFSRPRDEEELLDFPDRGAARRTLERLMIDHLVVREEGEKGIRRVRLASEVICPLVDLWAIEDSDVDRAARILARHFRQWTEGGRRRDDLLTGSGLALVARQLIALNGVTENEHRYVRESLACRRNQLAVRSLGVCLVAMVVLGLVYALCFRPGCLEIDSAPKQARVHLGKRLLGQTPLTWRARPGTYSLTLTKERYDPTRIDVRIPAGGVVEHRPVLNYPYGILAVGSVPSDAECEVFSETAKGRPVLIRKTPFTTELGMGQYQLRLTKAGYLPKTEDHVTINPNRELIHRIVSLTKNVGRLQIMCSEFGNMDVWQERKENRTRVLSATLPNIEPVELPVGAYRVDCRCRCGDFQSRNVTITNGETTSFAVYFLHPRELWSAETSGSVQTGPAIADLDGDGVGDGVVGTSAGKVLALSGKDGHSLWSFQTGADVLSSPALIDFDQDGVLDVAVGSNDRSVYALSGKTGTKLWQFATKGPVSSSPAVGDLNGDSSPDVVVGSQDHALYALSGKNGALLWSCQTQKEIVSSPALNDLDGDGIPDAVVGSNDGRVHAVSGKTGAALWVFKTGGPVESSPVLGDIDHDGAIEVAIGSSDRHVYVLSGAQGRLLWRLNFQGKVTAPPSLADLDGDGFLDLVVGSKDGRLCAVSGKSHGLLWTYATPKFLTPQSINPGSPILTAPMIGDVTGDGVPDVVLGIPPINTVVLNGRTGELEVRDGGNRPNWLAPVGLVDLDGDNILDILTSSGGQRIQAVSSLRADLQWVHRMEQHVQFWPVVADLDEDNTPDAVLALATGPVQAVSGRTGSVLWTTGGGDPVTSPLALTDLDQDGVFDVIACSRDKKVIALSGRNGKRLWDSSIPHHSSDQPALGDLDGDSIPDVVVGTPSGTVLAFSGRSGRPLWSKTVGHGMPGVGFVVSPDLADLDGDGVLDVVIASTDGKVTVLSGKTLSLRWTFVGQGEIRSAPILADLDRDGVDDLLFGGLDHKAHAVSGKTGRALWSVDLGHPITNAPCVADWNQDGVPDALFETKGGPLVAVSGKNGQPLWTYAGRGEFQRPTLAYVDSDDAPDVVVASTDECVHIVSGKTGLLLKASNLICQARSWASVVDLDESWRGRCLTGVGRLLSPLRTTGRLGPRRLAILSTPWTSALLLSRLPWPVRPPDAPAPVFFTNTRAIPRKTPARSVVPVH